MNWPAPVAEDSGFLARALPPLSTWTMRSVSVSTAESSVAIATVTVPSGSMASPS